MRSADLSRAAVAAALSLTMIVACSKDSSAPTPQFVGGWTGSTSQNQPLYFLASADGVVIVTVAVQVAAGSCVDTVIALVGRDPTEAAFPVTNGEFTVSWTTSLGNRVLTGTFEAGTASGTLAVMDNLCGDNLNVVWTAQKATGAAVNLTGTWDGEFVSSRFSPTPGQMQLSQSGASLTGSWSAGSGGSGTVSGTVAGYAVNFHLNQTTPGCSGQFDGYAIVTPYFGDLVFFYSGQDCLGPHVNGSGFGRRAAPAAGVAAERPRLRTDRN